jgi:hypothetical protein
MLWGSKVADGTPHYIIMFNFSEQDIHYKPRGERSWSWEREEQLRCLWQRNRPACWEARVGGLTHHWQANAFDFLASLHAFSKRTNISLCLRSRLSILRHPFTHRVGQLSTCPKMQFLASKSKVHISHYSSNWSLYRTKYKSRASEHGCSD